jgi:hypothetical protein
VDDVCETLETLPYGRLRDISNIGVSAT